MVIDKQVIAVALVCDPEPLYRILKLYLDLNSCRSLPNILDYILGKAYSLTPDQDPALLDLERELQPRISLYKIRNCCRRCPEIGRRAIEGELYCRRQGPCIEGRRLRISRARYVDLVIDIPDLAGLTIAE